MAALTEARVLDLWEACRQVGAAQRAVQILALSSGQPGERIAGLPLGERDAHLLRLYRQGFGQQVAAAADCPICGSCVHFTVDIDDLLALSPEPRRNADSTDFALEVDGFAIRCRLPDSRDLERAAAAREPEPARRRLLSDIVLSARRDGRSRPVDQLPEAVVAAIGDAVEARDPLSWTPIDLTCPECDGGWTPLFDIVDVLWSRLESRAERLLRDVQALAGIYGWSEADVLAISPARRDFYLQNAPSREPADLARQEAAA